MDGGELFEETPQLTVTSKVSSITPEIHGDFLASQPSQLFRRKKHGLLGFGEILRAEFSGPHRFEEASRWWAQLTQKAVITDHVERPGSGIVAFGAFTFDHVSRAKSVLIVPHEVVGFFEGGSFTTKISLSGVRPRSEARYPGKKVSENLVWRSGQVSAERFLALVSLATETIKARKLHKVVIARDLVAPVGPHFSMWPLVQQLEESYPDTHVFSVDGLFGASPETLASIRGRSVSLRVLAGSAARGENPNADHNASVTLSSSQKDLDEHNFAVRNVAQSLARAGIQAVADEVPFALKLPNLWHLATNVEGRAPSSVNGLDVVGELHPTAAVAGSPTPEAMAFLRANEGLDRGRYAGPVGWIDGNGDGDWAIALRCAQYAPEKRSLTAYAGSGIVEDSIPEPELMETTLKFRPITGG